MQRNTPLDQLIDKYLAGTATPQERARLERGYQQAVLRKPTAPGELQPAAIDRIGRETLLALLGRIAETRVRRIWTWQRVGAVAAVVLTLLSVGIWVYNDNHGRAIPQRSVFVNDAEPGREGATLTLGDGQRIRLDEASTGELARELGAVIRKSGDGLLTYELAEAPATIEKWNTLSTDSGQTYRVRLPDGSLVQLNAASSLEYPVNWAGSGERHVRLTGEGYFDIASDAQRPFVVDAAGQEVEVLGTRFNINGYAGEPAVETVLLEGSVKVTTQGNSHLLKPGEMARNDDGVIQISLTNTEQAIDWINGDFALNGLDFRTAMRKIARWYQVEVVYDESVPVDLLAGGWISRSTKLSDVLRLIENAGQVYFRVEGQTVYVFKQR